MTFFVFFDAYHDNGAIDPNIFPNLEAAVEYIHTFKTSEAIPINNCDTATIYQIDKETITDVDIWYQIFDADSGIVWVHTYEEVEQFWAEWRKSRPQPAVEDGSWGVTRNFDE